MSSRARRLGAEAPRDAFDWGAEAPAVRPPVACTADARRCVSLRRPQTRPSSTRRPWSATRSPRDTRRASVPAPRRPPHARTRCSSAWRRRSRSCRRSAPTSSIARSARSSSSRSPSRGASCCARCPLDPELLLAMARVALDRLTDTSTASIHLHPDDHAAAVAPRGAAPASETGVAIVADPSVRRGGCVVRSDFGFDRRRRRRAARRARAHAVRRWSQ